MTPLKISALLMTAAALFSGCQSVNVVERAEPRAEANLVDMHRIETDPGLARTIRVTGINESHSGDLLRIQVGLENRTYAYQTFNYQFVWIEQDGMQVQSPAPLWRPAQVEGRDTLFVSATAPNPRVVDFRLKLHSRVDLTPATGSTSQRRGPR